MMPDSKAKRQWMAENTTQISLKLNNKTDADILAALDGKSRQGEIKRLVRLGMEVERNGPDADEAES